MLIGMVGNSLRTLLASLGMETGSMSWVRGDQGSSVGVFSR